MNKKKLQKLLKQTIKEAMKIGYHAGKWDKPLIKPKRKKAQGGE